MNPQNLWKWARRAAGVLVTGVVVACGGGGGSAGTGSFGTAPTPTPTPTPVPTMAVTIVDANDSPMPSSAIGNTTYAKAVLRTGAGVAVANRLVTFTTDDKVASLSQATALTDASGVARTKISPVMLTAAAAGTVTATATVDGATVTGSVDYQATATNVTLTQFAASPTSITALQSSAVQVRALVNGVAATAGQVTVNFSASCGSFSPATAAVGSDGTAASVYQSVGTCSGPVTLTAQATGSPAVTTVVNVTAAKAANLLFDSVTGDVKMLYTSRAATGVKQATLNFKVVNAANEPMASQAVLFNLSTTAINAGVTFAGSGTATQSVSTDASGIAKVTVVAGTLPTPVIVTGTLASDSSLVASSLMLVVTTGVPAQDKASIALSKMSIEGFNIDGAEADVTFRVSDRQGNPIPVNTAVTLVASSGTIEGSCLVDATSACSVKYRSSGNRPANGRAAILAYLDGEEGFVDTNGNNYYDAADAAETLKAVDQFDVGMVFRDDNENGIRDDNEQFYPGGAEGGLACPYTPRAGESGQGRQASAPSVQNTCDGKWSSNIRVRREATLVLATSRAVITQVSRDGNALVVQVADGNGNSMPTGSTVAATLLDTGSTCTLVNTLPASVPNTTRPTNHTITLATSSTGTGTTTTTASCSTVRIQVTVTTPGGTATTAVFSGS